MRRLLSWLLLWCGGAVSRVERILPADWRIQTPLYWLFSWFMRSSIDVQGGGDRPGPWREVNSFGSYHRDKT